MLQYVFMCIYSVCLFCAVRCYIPGSFAEPERAAAAEDQAKKRLRQERPGALEPQKGIIGPHKGKIAPEHTHIKRPWSRAHGPRAHGPRAHGLMVSWTHGSMGPWTHGLMGPWALGPWAPGPWALPHCPLIIWAHVPWAHGPLYMGGYAAISLLWLYYSFEGFLFRNYR